MKQIERNRTWFFAIGLTALLGLGIVWGAYTLTFLQPFAEGFGEGCFVCFRKKPAVEASRGDA